MMKNKIIISALVCACLLLFGCACGNDTDNANIISEIRPPSGWEKQDINPGYSSLSSQDTAVLNYQDDKTVALVTRMPESDHSEFSDIKSVPGIDVLSSEKSIIFGIPAMKYNYSISGPEFSGFGEIIISEVRDGYFYKVTIISDKRDYSPLYLVN